MNTFDLARRRALRVAKAARWRKVFFSGVACGQQTAGTKNPGSSGAATPRRGNQKTVGEV